MPGWWFIAGRMVADGVDLVLVFATVTDTPEPPTFLGLTVPADNVTDEFSAVADGGAPPPRPFNVTDPDRTAAEECVEQAS